MFIGQINETWERLAVGQDLARIHRCLFGPGVRVAGREVTQALEGSFSAVSMPMFFFSIGYVFIFSKAGIFSFFPQIYMVDVFYTVGIPIGKCMENHESSNKNKSIEPDEKPPL